jgi:ribosome-associated heat shock protein Hsp15
VSHAKPQVADETDAAVRLDKWLWAARFFRARSAAADAIDVGQVRVFNGDREERVKPAKTVRAGDRVALRMGGIDREVVVRIAADKRMAAPIAQTYYAETEASLAARLAAQDRRRQSTDPAWSRKGRPTKRDYRELTAFVDSGRDPDGF